MTETLSTLLRRNAVPSNRSDGEIVGRGNDTSLSVGPPNETPMQSSHQRAQSQTPELPFESPRESTPIDATTQTLAPADYSQSTDHPESTVSPKVTMSNSEVLIEPTDYPAEPIEAMPTALASSAPDLANSLETCQEAEKSIPPLGQFLREEREKKAWPIEEVASHLKMTPNKLRALEQDDFGKMASPTYVIGYLRTYARWLSLTPTKEAELIATYREHYMEEVVLSQPLPPVKEPLESFRPPVWTKSVLVSVVLLTLVMGGFILWQKRASLDLPFLTKTATNSGESTDDAPSAEARVAMELANAPSSIPLAGNQGIDHPTEATDVAAEGTTSLDHSSSSTSPMVVSSRVSPVLQGESENGAVLDHDSAQADADRHTLIDNGRAPQSRDVASTPSEKESTSVMAVEHSEATEHSNQSPALPTAETASRAVLLEIVADSWMEIRDGSGQRRYTGVKKAGQQLVLNEVIAPISMHLGNARGVVIWVDGKEFPIQPRTGQDSLRVTIPAVKL